MDEINYHLPVFEGPLELLLSLISKNKVDISDIPIALIFDQYMEYINMAQAADMELAGDFIVMAAELMLIKRSEIFSCRCSAGVQQDKNGRGNVRGLLF